MQILRGIIFLVLLLISSIGFSGEVKPNQEKTTPEIVNKHMQDNYKLKVIEKIKNKLKKLNEKYKKMN